MNSPDVVWRPGAERLRTGPVSGWEELDLLLVEDDAGDALLVEELVAECRPRMRLWVASGLSEALEMVASRRPDCVLLDLNLPDSHGLDALAALQKQAAGVAVVVLTGHDEAETGFAAVASGAQDYLVKGRVDSEMLTRAVRYAVQRKQTEQAAVALQASEIRAQENARLERGLLPKPLIDPTSRLRVVARYQPGRANALLGGDFYDVVQSPEHIKYMMIGDVSGHGPDEAALGVALRIAWRTLVLSGIEGTERLRRLEEVLTVERSRDNIFATLACLSLHPDRRRLDVMRAGHPGFMVRTSTSVEWVELPGGPALGVLPDADWPIHELEMPDEDWAVVLLTDGLLEGRIDDQGERLGEEGLLALARELNHLTDPEEFLDSLLAEVRRLSEPFGGLDDDLAAVHVRWNPEP
ncbi:SpoIIE family protein phosphatase [soil metagenome]